MSEQGLDLAAIAAEAKAAVAKMSDAEVLNRLTNKQNKAAERKLKAAKAKEMKKALEAAIDARGAELSK